MYHVMNHECGGKAYLSGTELKQGWNLYCCSRCGEVFHKWVTEVMRKKN